MPASLDIILPAAQPLFVSRALAERPRLAAMVAEVIGHWSYVEGNIAKRLSTMMGGRSSAVIAMYNSILGFQTRKRMVLEAAETILQDELYMMLDIVMKLVDERARTRNSFAHHIWGSIEQLPDALLLIDGRDMARHFGNAHDWMRDYADDPGKTGPWTGIPNSKVIVWTAQELADEVEKFSRTLQITMSLENLMSLDPLSRDRRRQYHAFGWLSEQPETGPVFDKKRLEQSPISLDHSLRRRTCSRTPLA